MLVFLKSLGHISNWWSQTQNMFLDQYCYCSYIFKHFNLCTTSSMNYIFREFLQHSQDSAFKSTFGWLFFAAAWNFSEKVLKTLKRDMHLNIHNLLGILKKHCHKMIFIYGIWFLFFLLTHQNGYTLIFQILINLFFQLYYHWTTHYRTF